MHLLKNLTTIFLILLCLSSIAQKKDEIINKGITVKRSYEQDFKDGDEKEFLTTEEFFNQMGEVSEVKEYSDQGKNLDTWIKYKYDSNANIIEELELNSKGEQLKKTTYKFVDGLRVEKSSYDSKNRLTKKRTYKYEYR